MTDLAEAARATRRYEVVGINLDYYVIPRRARIWHPIDETISVAGPLRAEEAQAACDRLNLIAVLEALREPSEGMVAAGVHRARRDQIPAHVLATNWRAMIDAAVTEVKKSDEHI